MSRRQVRCVCALCLFSGILIHPGAAAAPVANDEDNRAHFSAIRDGELATVEGLLRTQLADGSWFVPTRSFPLQPHVETDFPHGPSQFISVAATSWATMALAMTQRVPTSPRAGQPVPRS